VDRRRAPWRSRRRLDPEALSAQPVLDRGPRGPPVLVAGMSNPLTVQARDDRRFAYGTRYRTLQRGEGELELTFDLYVSGSYPSTTRPCSATCAFRSRRSPTIPAARVRLRSRRDRDPRRGERALLGEWTPAPAPRRLRTRASRARANIASIAWQRSPSPVHPVTAPRPKSMRERPRERGLAARVRMLREDRSLSHDRQDTTIARSDIAPNARPAASSRPPVTYAMARS
jgi:hypothetical protein